jgi:hypothetical protein
VTLSTGACSPTTMLVQIKWVRHGMNHLMNHAIWDILVMGDYKQTLYLKAYLC